MEALMRWIAYVAALGAMISTSAVRAETRGVLELFTSQGCSSCPQADKLMGELAKDPSLVAFSLNVDYWDSLGWKDTLADPRNAERQRAYALLRGDRGVYTPQMVVNGTAHVVGSDKAAIERALASSRDGLPLPVKLAVNGGKLSVDLPAGTGAGEVWVYAVAKDVPVAVARGENRGRTITYHNAVRRWIKLGEWTGAAATWSFSIKDMKSDGVDAVAVLVQSGTAARPGPMLGAAMTALK